MLKSHVAPGTRDHRREAPRWLPLESGAGKSLAVELPSSDSAGARAMVVLDAAFVSTSHGPVVSHKRLMRSTGKPSQVHVVYTAEPRSEWAIENEGMSALNPPVLSESLSSGVAVFPWWTELSEQSGRALSGKCLTSRSPRECRHGQHRVVCYHRVIWLRPVTWHDSSSISR